MGHFDFSGRLNHNLPAENFSSSFSSPAPTTSLKAQSTPLLTKKSFKHVSAAAPTFSLQKQILLNNAHVYEKASANLVHSIIGSRQPVDTSNMNAVQGNSTWNTSLLLKFVKNSLHF